MGCQATLCNNCKRRIKSCEKSVANDGRSCCKYCVAAYNLKNKK